MFGGKLNRGWIMAKKNLSSAFEDLYDAKTHIKLLGHVVDEYETGGFDHIVGAGSLILQMASILENVHTVLEDRYSLNELEDEIVKLKQQRHEQLCARLSWDDKRDEIWKKHKAKADREIEASGVSYKQQLAAQEAEQD